MEPRARNRVVPLVALGALVAASWACGGSNGDQGGDGSVEDGPVDGTVESGPDGHGGHHDAGRDAHHDGAMDAGPDGQDGPSDAPDGAHDANDGGEPDVRDGSSDAHDGGGPDVHDAGGPDVHDSGGPDVHDSGMPDVFIETGPPFEAGSPPMVIATHETPTAIAADDTYVYWENSSSTVLDCPVSGCPGNIPTLLAFNGSGFGSQPLAVGNTTAFYVDSSYNLDSCSGAGCALSPALYAGTTDGGYSNYQSLVTDATNAYFTDGTNVYQCALGSTCTSPLILYAGKTTTFIGALAVSGSTVYFVRQGSFDILFGVPVGGGAATGLCSANNLGFVQGMVATTDYVYYTSGDVPADVLACPTAGGKVFVFAKDVAPYGVAADSTYLYWANYTSPGNVSACAIGSTCPTPGTVATGQTFPEYVAVNSTSVFWTTSTAIYSAVK